MKHKHNVPILLKTSPLYRTWLQSDIMWITVRCKAVIQNFFWHAIYTMKFKDNLFMSVQCYKRLMPCPNTRIIFKKYMCSKFVYTFSIAAVYSTVWYQVMNDHYMSEHEVNSCADIQKVCICHIRLFTNFYNPLPCSWSWLASYRKVPSWSAGLAPCKARI